MERADVYRPPIRLWVNESRQSQEAIRLVELTKLPFELIPATGHNIPAADLGPDSTFFKTLSGIELLVRGLTPEAYGAWLEERVRTNSGPAGFKSTD